MAPVDVALMESGSDDSKCQSVQPPIRMSRVVTAVLVIFGLVGSAFMLGRSSTVASAGSTEAVKFFDSSSTCDEISSWASGSHGVHGGNYEKAEKAAQFLKQLNCAGTPQDGTANEMCVNGPCKCGKVTCQKGSACSAHDGCFKPPAPCADVLNQAANTILPCTCTTKVCDGTLTKCDGSILGACTAPAR